MCSGILVILGLRCFWRELSASVRRQTSLLSFAAQEKNGRYCERNNSRRRFRHALVYHYAKHKTWTSVEMRHFSASSKAIGVSLCRNSQLVRALKVREIVGLYSGFMGIIESFRNSLGSAAWGGVLR